MPSFTKIAALLATAAMITSAAPASNLARSSSVKIVVDTVLRQHDVLDPILQHAGYQNSVNYNGFELVNVGPFDGVATTSSPNAIAVAQQTTEEAGGTSLNPVATATKSGDIKYFNLDSFFFGCVLDDANSVLDASTGCQIVVTAVDVYGKQVPEASFGFAPFYLVANPMVEVALPIQFSLGALVSYTIGISIGDDTTSLTVGLIDNVTRTNYYW